MCNALIPLEPVPTLKTGCVQEPQVSKDLQGLNLKICGVLILICSKNFYQHCVVDLYHIIKIWSHYANDLAAFNQVQPRSKLKNTINTNRVTTQTFYYVIKYTSITRC